MHFKGGDLSYIVKEGEKVFCEVHEVMGKERKRWQARLASQSIPKYAASLVYIGGGRPKGHGARLSGDSEMEANSNLRQWLGKRGVDLNHEDK